MTSAALQRATAPVPTPTTSATSVPAPGSAVRAEAASGATSVAAPPAPGAQTPAPTRVPWLDLARAGAIIAVVLFHLSIGHYYGMAHSQGGTEGMVAAWDRINQIVTAVRMPLLFTISGLLAANKIRRGFTRGSVIETAVTNYYLYAVWLIVYLGLLMLAGDRSVPFATDSMSAYAKEFWAPNTPLWFVFALAIYLLVFTALRRVHPAAVLTVLVMLHLASVQTWSLESPLWTRAVQFAVYFGIGVYGGRLIRAVAETPALAVLSTALAYLTYQQLGMTKLMALQPASVHDALLVMILYVTAGLSVMGMAALLARARPYAVFGRFVGRRTLGIYVMHVPVIVVFGMLIEGPFSWVADLVATNVHVDFFYPLVATAVVIAACMGLQAVLERLGFGALFALPSSVRTAITSTREHHLARSHPPAHDPAAAETDRPRIRS